MRREQIGLFYASDVHAEDAGRCMLAGGCGSYAGHGGWLYRRRHLPVKLHSEGCAVENLIAWIQSYDSAALLGAK